MSLRRLCAILLCVPLVGACQQEAGMAVSWHAPEPPKQVTGADGHRLPSKITLTDGVSLRPGNGPVGTYTHTGTENVALTFDDGPSPTYTPQLLAMLRQYNIKATFCLVGTEVEAYPELVRSIVADGHSLCNHSWHHDFGLGSQSDENIRENLGRTNDAIRRAVSGARIKYYRQPGGRWNSRIVAIAQSLGMRSLHWDVDPQDWRYGEEAIYRTVTSQTHSGSIVLMHDAGGNRANTMAACKRILPQLKARLKLVALP
ncbi:MAG: polysaccharide deacetylase family protein [Longispora sp.]|nr:polysaccharide deacetylase family protein [Longispora sp. (in: high G+C Gram-positive bacteria)]